MAAAQRRFTIMKPYLLRVGSSLTPHPPGDGTCRSSHKLPNWSEVIWLYWCTLNISVAFPITCCCSAPAWGNWDRSALQGQKKSRQFLTSEFEQRRDVKPVVRLQPFDVWLQKQTEIVPFVFSPCWLACVYSEFIVIKWVFFFYVIVQLSCCM